MERIIYCATNKINGKKYIGKTEKGLHHRIQTHKFSATQGSLSLFHRAIRKYGIEGFAWEILHKAKEKESLDELEKQYITEQATKFNDNCSGYNMTDGGDGGLMPEERRKEWGLKRKGKPLTEEHRRKISEGLARRADKTISPETREKISKAKKGFRLTEESKNKISAALKKAMTPERRKQIGDQHRGKTISDEQKKKLSEAHTGRPMDEKTKQALAKYWAEHPGRYKTRMVKGSK